MEVSRQEALSNFSAKSDKDGVIAGLRSQLHDLRHVVKEFGQLNSQLESLEGKYDLLLEERDRNQRDQKMKSEIDSAAIEQLQNELQQLNVQLDRANTEQQNHQTNNSAMQRMLESKHREADQIKRENLAIKARLDKKRAEVAGRFSQLRALKEEKNKMEDDLLSERQQVDQQLMHSKRLEREVKAKESDVTRLEKKLLAMNSSSEQLKEELQKHSEDLRRSTSKLSSMELTFDELMQQLKELEQLREQRQLQLADSKETYEQEARANRELQARLSKLEGEIRCKQREVDDLLARRNQQMSIQQKESDCNQSLNDRLDRNIEAILEYQSINQELVAEIRQYCRTDQKARQLLNRSTRMEEIIGRVEKRIKTSCGAISHILKR